MVIQDYENQNRTGKITFEEALEKTVLDISAFGAIVIMALATGFGAYSYMLMALTGLIVISTACVIYGSTIIVPTSACELNTTVTQQGVLAAVPLIGSILGAVLWGYLGDTFGRRSMALASLCAGAAFNCLASLSVTWVMLMVVQFVASVVASGQYVLAMTMLSECVPLRSRSVALLLVASIFLLSQGIMAVFAMPIIPLTFSIHLKSLGIYWNSWRTLVLIYSIPSLCSAIWLFFMHESPKYRFVKGDEAEAMRILKTIHKWNNRKNCVYEVEGILPERTTPGVMEVDSKVTPLFKMPLLKSTLIMSCLFIFQQVGTFVVWLPKVADQIMRMLETGEGANTTLCGIMAMHVTVEKTDVVPCSLNNTALVFVLIVGAMQSVMNIIMSLFVNKLGRRNMAMVITSTCGVAGVLINLVPNAFGSLALYSVFLMGLLVIGLYTAIGVAVFPTHLRATAISLVQAVGRVAAFFCIQILNVLLTSHCEVGFYIFAVLFATSAVVASFLPDDRFVVQPNQDNKDDQKSML